MEKREIGRMVTASCRYGFPKSVFVALEKGEPMSEPSREQFLQHVESCDVCMQIVREVARELRLEQEGFGKWFA